MKSIRLSFNFAVAKDTLRRCWPLWAAYLAFLILTFPVPLSAYIRNTNPAPGVDLAAVYSDHCLNLAVFQGNAGIVVAILAVMILFGWMYGSRGNTLVNLLPVRREGVFLTLYLTGLLPMLFCQALVMLLTMLLCEKAGIAAGHYLTWFTVSCLSLVAFYGFSVFCAMLTGNILVLPAVYFVLNLAAWVFESCVRECLGRLVYGLSFQDMRFEFLSPIVKVSDSLRVLQKDGANMLEGIPVLRWYAAAGLVLSAAALLLYRRRRSESVSDIVAIPALKPVFRACMSFGAAVVLAAFLLSSSGPVYGAKAALLTAATLTVGAVIGWIAAEMMIRRTLKVFPLPWKGLAAVCLVCVLTVIAAEMDLTGFEKRVPDPGQVERVEFDYGSEFCEADNIRAVTQLHRVLVENKALYDTAESYTVLGTAEYGGSGSGADQPVDFYVSILYHMKDGSEMHRAYTIRFPGSDVDRPESVAGMIRALVNSPEGIRSRMESTVRMEEQNIMYAMIDQELPNGDWTQYRLTPREAVELWNSAILPDAEQEHLCLYTIVDTPQNMEQQTNLRIEIVLSDGEQHWNHSFRVFTFSEHCLDWIAENARIQWMTMNELMAEKAEDAAG